MIQNIKKAFWTFICFIAFAIFITAITTGMWWLNAFVIILGLAFKYYGEKVVFPEYIKRRKIKEQKMQEYLEKRQNKNINYLKNRNRR